MAARRRNRPMWAWLYMLLLGLSGCAGSGKLDGPALLPAAGWIASVAVGPDARLWRVRAGADHVYVDHAVTIGQGYSEAVVLNPEPQHIRAQSEDRPAIAVDGAGGVAVIYYAQDGHRVRPYYTYSADGLQFTPPQALGLAAPGVEHSMVRLLRDPAGRLVLFWYQMAGKHAPNGAALFYTSAAGADGLAAPDRKVGDALCECCRLAVDFADGGQPVLFARVIFPGNVRDHGLLGLAAGSTPRRITDDNWRINACPKQGPALSIAEGRYHFAWFTQGAKRQGLFYAYAEVADPRLSQPVPIGQTDRLPQHADVLALDHRVLLAWTEFDGRRSSLRAMHSSDRGKVWSEAKTLAGSGVETDHPDLITDGRRVFVSWSTQDAGHRLIPLP